MLTGELQDRGVSRVLQVVFTDVHSVDVCITQQPSDTMREVGAEEKLHRPAVTSGSSRTFLGSRRCILQRSRDVRWLQVGEVLEDLARTASRRQLAEDGADWEA